MSAADYRTLQQLPTIEMALAFYQLVRQQATEEQRRRAYVITEADLGDSTALEHVAGSLRARMAVGPGGGTRTPTRETQE